MSSKYVVGMVLAGGAGRRLSPDKGRHLVGGIPIIDRVLAALTPVVDDIIIVGHGPPPPGLRLLADEQPGAGPLAAIYTGMSAAPADVYLVVAWDMPFLTSDLLRYLLGAGQGFDAAVPVVGGQEQPLCAAYGRSCLAAIGEAVAAGQRRVISFFSEVQVRRITEAELKACGAPEVLLFNVNTAQELAAAEQMVGDSE